MNDHWQAVGGNELPRLHVAGDDLRDCHTPQPSPATANHRDDDRDSESRIASELDGRQHLSVGAGSGEGNCWRQGGRGATAGPGLSLEARKGLPASVRKSRLARR